MNAKQAGSGHLPMATGGEWVHLLSYQFLRAIDGGTRLTHLPLEGGVPKST